MNFSQATIIVNNEEVQVVYNMLVFRKIGQHLNLATVTEVTERVNTALANLNELDNLEVVAVTNYYGVAEWYRQKGETMPFTIDDMYTAHDKASEAAINAITAQLQPQYSQPEVEQNQETNAGENTPNE